MESGRKLKEHMRRMRMDRIALAEAVGVSREAVRQWLSGGGITGKYVGRLAKALRWTDAETVAFLGELDDGK